MSRIYGYDIISRLETIANNVTYGINATITEINTARSLTGDDAAPLIENITSFWEVRRLPELFISISGSTMELDEDDLGGGGQERGTTYDFRDVNSSVEVFTVDIVATHKAHNDYLTNYMEIYSEAIFKTFHKYCDTDITWILATGSLRDQINTKDNQGMKFAGYTFDLRIN